MSFSKLDIPRYILPSLVPSSGSLQYRQRGIREEVPISGVVAINSQLFYQACYREGSAKTLMAPVVLY